MGVCPHDYGHSHLVSPGSFPSGQSKARRRCLDGAAEPVQRRHEVHVGKPNWIWRDSWDNQKNPLFKHPNYMVPNMCMHIYLYIYICIFIYIYIYIYTHNMYVHIYIYIYVCVCVCVLLISVFHIAGSWRLQIPNWRQGDFRRADLPKRTLPGQMLSKSVLTVSWQVLIFGLPFAKEDETLISNDCIFILMLRVPVYLGQHRTFQAHMMNTKKNWSLTPKSVGITKLVGGLVAIFYFPYVGCLIIPIDFHIFQRGGPTTNQQRFVIISPIFPTATGRHRSPVRTSIDLLAAASMSGGLCKLQATSRKRASENTNVGIDGVMLVVVWFNFCGGY